MSATTHDRTSSSPPSVSRELPMVSGLKKIPINGLLAAESIVRTSEEPPAVRLAEPVPIEPVTRKPIKAEIPGFGETTETRKVCAQSLIPRPPPTHTPRYVPFQPPKFTYVYKGTPAKMRVAPAQASKMSFDEFKEKHLCIKRPARDIECVDLVGDGNEKAKPPAPAPKRQRTGSAQCSSLQQRTRLALANMNGTRISVPHNDQPPPNAEQATTLSSDQTCISVSNHESESPQINSLTTVPILSVPNMVVELAVAPSSKETTSISSPEMYRKIRDWLILYVDRHSDLISEAYWARCCCSLKQELGIPVHREFLHKMWGQIGRSLIVEEAKRIRHVLRVRVAETSPPASNSLNPRDGPHIIKKEAVISVQMSHDKAHTLQGKRSLETVQRNEQVKRQQSSTSPSKAGLSIKGKGSEEELRQELFLKLLSSSGSSPASSKSDPHTPNRVPYLAPKDVYKALLKLFSRVDRESYARDNATGKELTLAQAHWLISYETQNSPPGTERKPSGYWNVAAHSFNAAFAIDWNKKSVTEMTARLMKYFERGVLQTEE